MTALAGGRLRGYSPGWETRVGALLLMLAGAAGVMLLPRVFGDPQGVDPDVWRLTAYFACLSAWTLVLGRLRRLAPLALALLTLTFPYSLWMWLLGYQGPLSSWLGAPYGLLRNALSGAAWLLAALLLALAFRLLVPSPRPRLRILTRPTLGALLLGLGVSALFLVIAFALPAGLIGRQGVPLLALGGSAGAALGFANAAQAVAQEVQFRGVLLGALERELGRRGALVAQALIFGVAHIAIQYQGPAESFIPIVILLGLIWGWMTQRTQSIIPAAMVHVIAELFLLATIVSGLYGS